MNTVSINSNIEQIKNNALGLFNSLSSEKMKEAFDYLSYLNDKEEWEATRELESSEIIDSIKNGIEDLKKGDFVKFNDIRKNV